SGRRPSPRNVSRAMLHEPATVVAERRTAPDLKRAVRLVRSARRVGTLFATESTSWPAPTARTRLMRRSPPGWRRGEAAAATGHIAVIDLLPALRTASVGR